MWHASSGNRTLTGAEAALVCMSVRDMVELIIGEASAGNQFCYRVGPFDSLPRGQRAVMLLQVVQALVDDATAMPELTAVNEATVAAIFQSARDNVSCEMDLEDGNPDEDLRYFRRAVLAACAQAAKDDEDDDEECATLSIDEPDHSEWHLLVDAMEDRILWDQDWAMAEERLDDAPATGKRIKGLAGIEAGYYTTPAADADDSDVESLCAQLHKIISPFDGGGGYEDT